MSDWQFESRLAISARDILRENAGLPEDQILIPATAGLDYKKKLSTPRVEIAMDWTGRDENFRLPKGDDQANDGQPQRTYFSRFTARLSLTVITDRDWNLSSHSVYCNAIRQAILFSTDAQWEREVDGVREGYELFWLAPEGGQSSIRQDQAQDITEDTWSIVFAGPSGPFTPPEPE